MPDLTADGPIPESTPEAAAPAYAELPASIGEYAERTIGETAEMAEGAAKRAAYQPGFWGAVGRGAVAGGEDLSGVTPGQGAFGPDLAPLPSPTLDKAEATARYPDIAKTAPDLFADNMPEGAVDALAESKRNEIEREGVFRRYEAAHSWYTNFPTRTALTMLDPINTASLLIPGVGEEAVFARLGSGALARTGARAIAGATAGAAGMTLGIGTRYALSQAEGGDYSLRQAFLDLASGAAFGALIHAGIGGLREGGVLRPDRLMTGRPDTGAEPPPEAATEAAGEALAPTGPAEAPAGALSAPAPILATPEVAAVANADAATRYDATRAAVAQVMDGRQVDVEPVLAAPKENGAELAQQQADLHRTGYQPSMTAAELATATEDLYGKPHETISPSIPPGRQVAALAQSGESAAPDGAPTARADGVPGQAISIGKIDSSVPNGVENFTPEQLGVDPERFQFKAGGDEAGVTERLKGVKVWDPIKAGMALVWVDRDGKPWIVDGHQRLSLAKRIAAEDPSQQPQILARTLNEADGVTPEMARAVAAMKNIAEGTGTAVDAAKIIRDHPELAGDLPPRSELVRQARGLVNLDPDAFRMVVNDVVPPNYAAIVGRLVPTDGKMQGALLGLLAKTEPANSVQAEAIVRQGIEAGTHVETQASLFGDQEVATSLYLERARVLDQSLKQLRRDKTVFGTLVKESDILEEAGNKLAKDINEKRATADAHALQILQILANRIGPISDALGSAARRAKSDGSSAGAVRDFVAAVRKSASSGDLTRLANGIERGASHVGDEGGGNAIGPGLGAEPVSDSEQLNAAAEIRQALAPAAEAGADHRPQLVIPGTERSARQAAAAGEQQRRGMMQPTLPQQEPGGLFAPRTAETPSLFADLDPHIAQAEQHVSGLSLTPEDHAEIGAANDAATTADLMEQAYAQAGACLNGVI